MQKFMHQRNLSWVREIARLNIAWIDNINYRFLAFLHHFNITAYAIPGHIVNTAHPKIDPPILNAQPFLPLSQQCFYCGFPHTPKYEKPPDRGWRSGGSRCAEHRQGGEGLSCYETGFRQQTNHAGLRRTG